MAYGQRGLLSPYIYPLAVCHQPLAISHDEGFGGKGSASPERMLFLVVLCIVLWALGLMTSYTLGGLLHILLVIAIILFLVHVIQGRSIADS